MIAIIDYGAGNILSVDKALRYIGCQTVIVKTRDELMKARAAVLPGVGSFGDAMSTIRLRGLEEPIKKFIDSNRPFLGICLGLQVLFESSEESPGVEGLSVLKGKILRIPQSGLKIPHIGWNSLDINREKGLYEGIGNDTFVYFVHSYYLKAEEDIVTASTDYGVKIDASVEKGSVMACQYHPEKSGESGIQILKNFASKIYDGGNFHAR